jgi:hypothetical protein
MIDLSTCEVCGVLFYNGVSTDRCFTCFLDGLVGGVGGLPNRPRAFFPG